MRLAHAAPRRLRPLTTVSMPLTRHLVLFAVAAGSAACAGSTDPDPRSVDARQRARRWSAEQLQLALGALPPSLGAGEAVRLVATVHNPTDATVDLGQECGVPLAFEVTAPSGARIYPIPLGGPFTCERLDLHDIEPGETDAVTFEWSVPRATGRYRVRAGVRMLGRLERRTAAREFEVR
jgi:hypothetical protein